MIQPGSVCSATRIARVLEIRRRADRSRRAPVRGRCRGSNRGLAARRPDSAARRPAPRVENRGPWYTGPRVSKRSAGGGPSRICLELALAQRRQRRAGRSSWRGPRRSQHLVDFEVEDVARRRRAVRAAWSRRPSSTKMRRTRPNRRVRSNRRFSRSRTRARACRSTQPKSSAPQRMCRAGLADAPLRLVAEPSAADRTPRQVGPAGRGKLSRELPTARNSGSGSSCSVALSSFSSFRHRSPNFARYAWYCVDECRVRRPSARLDLGRPCRVVSRSDQARRARRRGGRSRCMRRAGSALTMPPSPPSRSFCSVPSGSPHQRVDQPAQHAVEDHREEVVDERRIPAEKQLGSQVAVMCDQLVGYADRPAAAPAAPARVEPP